MKKHFNFCGMRVDAPASRSFSPAPPAHRMNGTSSSGRDMTSPSSNNPCHISFLGDPARWMTPAMLRTDRWGEHYLSTNSNPSPSAIKQTTTSDNNNDPHRRFHPRRLQSRLLHIQLMPRFSKPPSRHRPKMEHPIRLRQNNLRRQRRLTRPRSHEGSS